MAPIMVDRNDWDSEEVLVDYLARQLRKGRLCLVLGSGISVPFGLPMWSELVRRLAEGAGESFDASDGSLERQAEFIKANHFENNYDGFLRSVHEALYRNVAADFDSLRENRTIAALGSLIMSSRRGSSSEIFTFNFDNLLATYLQFHGFVTQSLYGSHLWASYADASIFHPHGFLPLEFDDLSSEPELVFDQSSYSKVVGNEADPWRQRLLSAMRSRTCLFIGISGADNNLDSMISNVGDQHASVLDNSQFWGVTISDSENRLAKSLWEKRKVYYKTVSSYDSGLPEFLFSIARVAARMTEA